MVIRASCAVLLCIQPLLAQAEKMQITKLEPRVRAKVIGALVLLTMAGIALVVLSWLVLRIGRRQARREDHKLARRQRQLNVDDWAEKPLAGSQRGEDSK